MKMCGLCGQFNYKNHNPVNNNVIAQMTNTMIHRGPDDDGYYFSNSIGLGFRRLSIIDIHGGHQPMSDKDKLIWGVFNGEIYNFKELKTELECYGHHFKTKSDTEVIILGYKQWGIDVLDHLNGMFGLAIWDEKQKQLMLARDRMGIKLLYYKIEDESLYFASEIRAILAAFSERSEIDTASLNLFLRYRYTPSPLTIFKGIYKIAPGTRLIANKSGVKVERWWNFKPSPFVPVPKKKIVVQDLMDLYKASIKRHLISDVPLGLLLSGGIDSGLLLALMSIYGSKWKTYSIGYGKSFKDDELRDAELTAQFFNAQNFSIELNRNIFEATLTKVIKYLEEPIASSSVIPMYHICERARQDVKVALMGQGPDELFGGYKRHLGILWGSYWRKVPGIIRKPLKEVMKYIPRNEALKRSIYSLDVPQRLQRYQQVFSILPASIVDGLFHKDILPIDSGNKILDCWNGLENLLEETDELGGFQFLEIRSSLPDELLMYADKLSMAHGLELRVPYLDKEIVEYVERIPAQLKIHMNIRKYIHKEVCKYFLPKHIINRKKRGFAVNVVDGWFRDSMNGKMSETLLQRDSHIFNYLRFNEVNKLIHEHKKGFKDNHKILFSLILFEEWLRSYYYN